MLDLIGIAAGLLSVAAGYYFKGKEETVARVSLILGVLILVGVGVHALRRRRGSGATLSWTQLEARFKDLRQRELENRMHGGRGNGLIDAVEHFEDNTGVARWGLMGSSQELRAEAERLFAIAGRKLLLIRRSLSPELKREQDDVRRWIEFLVEVGGHERHVHSASDATEEGQLESWTYSIDEVVKESVAGCMEAMRRESTG